MIASKMTVLKPLIESKNGQHLTAYLVNNENITDLNKQLRESLDMAYEYLAPNMNPEALIRFLAPLHNMLEDSSLLPYLKGNIGIFRNENSFRILSLPVPVEQTCVIATSFHVKPLLRWIQFDREFLFIGFTENSVSLYQGNQNSFNLIDTIVFESAPPHSSIFDAKGDMKSPRRKTKIIHETKEWLHEFLFDLKKESKPRLYIGGTKDLSTPFLKECRYPHTRRQILESTFNPESPADIYAEIRTALKKEMKKEIEQALVEFYQAEDLNLTNKNLFQIAKAAIQGKVKKLIIANGISIFGKIDRKSGGLSIHPTHLDHEDDDLLDDLAQEVLSHGGEVIVAEREEIPKGRPILAILERENLDLAKHHSIIDLERRAL